MKEKNISKEELLTTKEAAEFLRVSEASIRRWTASGEIKCYRIGKRQIRRISKDSLIEYLQKSKLRIKEINDI